MADLPKDRVLRLTRTYSYEVSGDSAQEEPFTGLIDRHHCHPNEHQDRGITLAILRSNNYWIIAGNSVGKKYVWKSVTCRKLNDALSKSKMAD